MHDHPDCYNRSPRSLLREIKGRISKLWHWLKDRVSHKLEHIKPAYLLDVLTKHGLSLVVIIVVWEIIEDIGFPLLFIWLGNNVHPAFMAGAPAAWLLCLHWLVVPLTWKAWVKIKGQRNGSYKND